MHICGESCFKYSGTKVHHICRFGCYYVVELGEWRRRRRGKALRDTVAIVEQAKFGMQGRLLNLQEHPYEGPSNYAGLGAIRCNLDVQSFHRVSVLRKKVDGADTEELYWLPTEAKLPHVGDRPAWGYMNEQEWDGQAFRQRRPRPLRADPPLFDMRFGKAARQTGVPESPSSVLEVA